VRGYYEGTGAGADHRGDADDDIRRVPVFVVNLSGNSGAVLMKDTDGRRGSARLGCVELRGNGSWAKVKLEEGTRRPTHIT
jgi:hypothetical protein